MKIWKAILHTSGKTGEDIQADGNQYSEEEVKGIVEYMNAWDGIEIFVTVGFSGCNYVIAGWPDESDEKVKEAIYMMEQDIFFGCYRNDREGFDSVWENGEYSPSGSISFEKEDVEILEQLKTN